MQRVTDRLWTVLDDGAPRGYQQPRYVFDMYNYGGYEHHGIARADTCNCESGAGIKSAIVAVAVLALGIGLGEVLGHKLTKGR